MAKWIRNKYDEILSYESLMRAHKLSCKGKKLRREVILFSLKEEEYIKYLAANNYEITYEGKTGYTMTKRINLNTIPTITEDYIQDIANIQPGSIVLATRKSTSGEFKDYTWQGTYYGKLNEHYLLDYNGTHYQVADSISGIPTLTKKEAKQKVSELFANPKNVSSEQIRNIIDLIKA